MEQNKNNDGKQSRIFVGLISFLVGIVLIGGILYLVNFSGRQSAQDAAAFQASPTQFSLLNTVDVSGFPTATATIQPTVTITSTVRPSQTPTLTVTPVPVVTREVGSELEQRLLDVYDDVVKAKGLSDNENYVDAILIWDRVIEAVPEYTYAYHQRGLCYLRLLDNQRYLEEYRRYNQLAIEDYNMAIELGPLRGNYLANRANANINLANIEDVVADSIPYLDAAIEDVTEALPLGSSIAHGNYYPFIYMYKVGYCSQALDYFLELEALQDPAAEKQSLFVRSMALAYICLENYDKAIEYLDAAADVQRANGRNPERELYYKAVVYHTLGRNQEALEIMDGLIESSPYYSGYRYYLRGLLHYELGQPEQAYEDLYMGMGNTWGHYSVRAYVMGKLALDEGDAESALEWFQMAEATINRYEYPYIYKLALYELAQLGGGGRSSLPSPQISSIPLVSDQDYAQPELPSSCRSACPLMYNYDGTGFIFVDSYSQVLLLFRPVGYHHFDEITSLTIEIDGFGKEGDTGMTYYFDAMDRSGANAPEPLVYGENQVTEPGMFVDDSGYFILVIRNTQKYVGVLENIRIQLEAVDQNGRKSIYGYEN